MSVALDRVFLDYSGKKLRQLGSRIQACLRKLDDGQVWARGGEQENAVGNLVLHLCGNVRQWIVSGVGGAPDRRDRDAEFAARGGVRKKSSPRPWQRRSTKLATRSRASARSGSVSASSFSIMKYP